MSLRIHVDKDKCQGHARCFEVDGTLFPLDVDGYSAIDDALVSPTQRQVVVQAELACPEQAISLIE